MNKEMDRLDKWSRDIYRIDRKIIVLYEHHMNIIRRSAEYKKRNGLKIDKKFKDEIIEKVTTGV